MFSPIIFVGPYILQQSTEIRISQNQLAIIEFIIDATIFFMLLTLIRAHFLIGDRFMGNKLYISLLLPILYCTTHGIQAEPFALHANDLSCYSPFISNFHAAMSNSPRYIEKNADSDQYWLGIKNLYTTHAVQDLKYAYAPRIPKIIHQIWLGSSFPEKYIYFQSTWKLFHPDWEYRLWTEAEIEAFGLTNKAAYDESTNWGQKSDIARYEILYRMGGLYVDTDFECLNSFDILHHCFDFYTGTGFGPSFHAYMGLIGAAPGNKIIKQCIDTINIHATHNADPMLNILFTTGPYLFTGSIKKLLGDPDLGRCVVFPVNYFYPLPNLLNDVTYEETRAWIRPETFAMHHWHVSWNNGVPPGKKNKRLRDKFVLITSLYNETEEVRIAEYIVCMEKNLAHAGIGTIHVFYDTSKDDKEKNILLDYLRAQPVVIHYIAGRPTYHDCFELANLLHPDQPIIIGNADVYYNETLSLLDTYNLTDKFLALTRWNVQEDGSLKIYMWPHEKPAIGSQDTWIFKTPIAPFQDKTILIGVPHCDARIAYQANQSGLKVLNPCLSLQCCHVHLSGIRHYMSLPRPKEMMTVPWCSLT